MTLSAVIIGNEVLTAKVTEANGTHLIKRAREKGIRFRSLLMVPDEIDLIVEAIHTARGHAAHVVTSGGIGPTHDDVTVRAVALAIGRNVVRLPEMEQLILGAYENEVPPAAAMRMAEAPEGSRLIRSSDLRFPVLACEHVFMLPGVPQLFRLQLEAVLQQLPGDPVALATLYLSIGEPEVAAVLDRIALEFADVALGSYPTWDAGVGYKVKITIEHRDATRVGRVRELLIEGLPRGCIVKMESEDQR